MSFPCRPQLTAVAVRELFEEAFEALDDDSEAYEMHDLRTWMSKFKSKLREVADYRSDDLGGTR